MEGAIADTKLWSGAQNAELELKYKGCYARILDSKRRFLEAATRYYDLSQAPSHGEPGVQVRLCHALAPKLLAAVHPLPRRCHRGSLGMRSQGGGQNWPGDSADSVDSAVHWGE